MSTTETLLNIKQAAKILNVSEISLRRWSNSGKLPCLRVGVRRERRFRAVDLFTYLEQGNSTDNKVEIGHQCGRVAQILLQGISIDYGSHLCSFYDTDAGRLKLALPFLLGGIESGERCFLVASPEVQTIILNELRATRPHLDQDIEDGHLVVMDGLSDGEAMYQFFEESFLKASKQGIQGLRVLGDMAWALQKGISIEALSDFEARYNQGLGHCFPVVSLCQYDARVFSGRAIVGALKCHNDTFQYPLAHFLGV